jgi:hypothetical protein
MLVFGRSSSFRPSSFSVTGSVLRLAELSLAVALKDRATGRTDPMESDATHNGFDVRPKSLSCALPNRQLSIVPIERVGTLTALEPHFAAATGAILQPAPKGLRGHPIEDAQPIGLGLVVIFVSPSLPHAGIVRA